MANTLKVWMAPNTVTPDPKDKIFILETTGKADINKIYEEMRAEDTGLRPETIVHVVTLFERICARLLMNGWQLNTGLFYACLLYTSGVHGHWGHFNIGQIPFISGLKDHILRGDLYGGGVHMATIGHWANVGDWKR